jgi:hypothetical protein
MKSIATSHEAIWLLISSISIRQPRPSDDYDLVFHERFGFDLRCSDGASDES